MAITSLSLTRVSTFSVRLSFASDLGTPTFYVWKDGRFYASTTAATLIVPVPEGSYPVFDVFDDAADQPTWTLPDTLLLQWAGLGSSAASYRVEQYVGAAWVTRSIEPERGRAYYQWRSPRLADQTACQFRVVAVGPDGNETVSATYAATMVRQPDPPAVALSYDEGTGDVTVAERT